MGRRTTIYKNLAFSHSLKHYAKFGEYTDSEYPANENINPTEAADTTAILLMAADNHILPVPSFLSVQTEAMHC